MRGQPAYPGFRKAPPDAGAEMIIQGQEADSSYEYNFALALEHFMLPYIYQPEFFGGRVLGGVVPDFLVETAPLETLCFINGEYSHGSGERQEQDFLQQAQIQATYMGLFMIKNFLYEDVGTPEWAVAAVRRELL